MSFTITEALVQSFQSDVHHVAQQKLARLLDAVRVKYGVVGESHKFDILGSGEMQAHTRHGDTKITNREHTKRLAVIKFYEDGELLDKEDQVRTLTQPQNEYSTAIVSARNRRIDRTVYEECLKPTTTTAKSGANGAGLTFDLVNQVREAADEAEWDEDGRFFGVTGMGLTKLLADAKLSSADYNVVKALVAGTIPPDTTWMGFKWRKFNAANVTRTYSGSDVDTETLYAWHKNGVGLAFAQEPGQVPVAIDRRPDKSNAVQVLGKVGVGGQCIEDMLVIPVVVDHKT